MHLVAQVNYEKYSPVFPNTFNSVSPTPVIEAHLLQIYSLD